MDLDLLPALLGIALLDSLNPSALVVALWLLSRAHAAPRLLAYVGGILVAYLALGVAMMLGDAVSRWIELRREHAAVAMQPLPAWPKGEPPTDRPAG